MQAPSATRVCVHHADGIALLRRYCVRCASGCMHGRPLLRMVAWASARAATLRPEPEARPCPRHVGEQVGSPRAQRAVCCLSQGAPLARTDGAWPACRATLLSDERSRRPGYPQRGPAGTSCRVDVPAVIEAVPAAPGPSTPGTATGT